MDKALVKKLQKAMNDAGHTPKFAETGNYGALTEAALKQYEFTVSAKKVTAVPLPPTTGERPSYYLKSLVIEGVEVHPYYPVPAPYTHPHPMDMSRSMAFEKEKAGKAANNVLIAHAHEHSPNLAKPETGGPEDAKNNYADEVPHCMSHQNLVQDLCGCEKSSTALANTGRGYAKRHGAKAYKKGDTVPEGANIVLTGHITRANKAFVWDDKGSFEGYGANQGNTIKTSLYAKSKITAAYDDKPKPGTVLAPIGTLPFKSVPPNGKPGESTR